MMGAGKEMWIAEYEQACEDYTDGIISADEFRAKLARHGLDDQEIDNHVTAINEDNAEPSL